ncbi:hypothetical protein CROQUDRAFT_54090 [Cronartium quercuum f. sp. fusiforme G11]|uniref:Uncharacterized protein n=1 Tax=Cronartium quercuum f. sp. fusiforme G11 TaxID=708437 RepID=A0A9P6N9G5_9BASI|nr:hypothetical protein CROQUDRAFT_54090 [Cronartium quercuum f. sp. fusiforme G11]
MTSLLDHIQAIHKDAERLESDGFKWTKDMVIGMFYQVGAPVSGPYSMEMVNIVLDMKYKMNKGEYSMGDVHEEMQAALTN